MEKVLLFLAIVVGAPLAEELFFRGLLQNLLVRWWRPWVGILVTALLAIPLAGPDAIALQRKGLLELQPIRHDIDESLQTDAAWERFFDIDSAVRAQVKTGKVTVDVYETWLQSTRDDFRRSLSSSPRLDAKTAVEAQQPLPAERAALDRILAGVVKRFGIAPPSTRTVL